MGSAGAEPIFLLGLAVVLESTAHFFVDRWLGCSHMTPVVIEWQLDRLQPLHLEFRFDQSELRAE